MNKPMNSVAIPLPVDLTDIPPRLNSNRHRRAFGYALLASALIHTLLILFVPGFRNAMPNIPLPERLDVLLRPHSANLPPPPASPLPPRIQPRTPTAQPQIVRKAEREPSLRPPDQPIVTAAPEAPAPAPAVPEPPRSIEPVPPLEALKPETRPVAPAPQTDAPSDTMISAFGRNFKASIDNNRRYPRLALQRGWQGTVTLLVRFVPGGRIGEIAVARSSGFDVLDEAAREMVRSAEVPSVSDALRKTGFELRVPVEFKLE